MPITDTQMYTETITKAAAAPFSIDNKGQGDIQFMLSPSNSIQSTDNVLTKHQGQKWLQVIDFEKVFKQIRIAEKQLKNKADNSTSNNSAKNSNAIGSNSPPKAAPQSACPLKQVQRLYGSDMPYYGLVPKQTPVSVVICNVCTRFYTKVGFTNHMITHHPTIWNSVPNKINTTANDGYIACPADNHLEAAREIKTPEVMSSPSDVSTSISLSSTVSSSSSSLLSSHAGNSRHKSSKNGSSGSGRSRSKAKHHSSSAGIHLSSPLDSQSKNSKKNLSAHTANTPAIKIMPVAISSNTKDTSTSSSLAASNISSDLVPSITVFSSSSNSSCSLPPTPKMSVVQENIFSPGHQLSTNNGKEKNFSVDTTPIVSTPTPKKKEKISKFLGQESIDSSASSCSTEIERGSSFSLASSNKTGNSTGYSNIKYNKNNNHTSVTKPTGNNYNHFDPHLSELDQAVSSIIGVQSNEIDLPNDDNIEDNTNAASINFTMQQMPTAKREKGPTFSPGAPGTSQLPINYTAQEAVSTLVSKDQTTQKLPEDNTILTLEDMLDSKFINDILNTTESEIQFHGNDLNASSQQPYMQQPATKRMRYEETTTAQQQPTEPSEEFSLYQQQQLLEHQQHRQYPQYDGINLEDIKIFNEAQPPINIQYQAQTQQSQQQQQPITLDPLQLQQLLYQQQNIIAYGNNIDRSTSVQQQQFEQASVDSKQNINMVSNTDIVKTEFVEIKTEEITVTDNDTAISIDNEYVEIPCDALLAAQLELFNIPSLSDDMDDVMLPNIVETSHPPEQYVLPSSEEQIIYEITDNNQVSILSQQRQQEVIAEFLTQAGYQNVENANAIASTNNNSIVNNKWYNSNELQDYELSLIDTMKSLSSHSSHTHGNHTSNSLYMKGMKTEQGITILEDSSFGIFFYTGIPRPLLMNSFGLVKLHQNIATTFRKNLLTIRKANNNHFSVNARFGSSNAKSSQNFFTSTTGSSGALTNEFSLVPVTNTPGMSQQQKQQSAGGAVEMTFNISNANGLPASAIGQKAKLKGSTGALNISRPYNRQNTMVHSSKTIYVNVKNANQIQNANNRIKLTSHVLITKINQQKNSHFTTKQVVDILNGKCLHRSSPSITMDVTDERDDQLKLERVKRFYEHRKKLLNVVNNSRLKQCKLKLVHNQPFRTFSEFNINNIQSKSANACSDNMRFFI